jgi:hypothetical protein
MNENWKYKTSIQGMQFLIFILYSHYVHKERRKRNGNIIFTRNKAQEAELRKKYIFVPVWLFEFS